MITFLFIALLLLFLLLAVIIRFWIVVVLFIVAVVFNSWYKADEKARCEAAGGRSSVFGECYTIEVKPMPVPEKDAK